MAQITTNYTDTITLSGTGASFWLSSVECDGEYEVTNENKVITITYTNCNYVIVNVGGSNVTYV